jgi:hypothetical protein
MTPEEHAHFAELDERGVLSVEINDQSEPWVRVGLNARDRDHVAVFRGTRPILWAELADGGSITIQADDHALVARWALLLPVLGEVGPTPERVALAIRVGRDALKAATGDEK